ncbi:large exoprotein [Microbacterium sp.]|uniref:large exoprotein n=1 Tax=Microbacterium sp. TaxID=51671 RepID=UPI003A891B5A
MTTNYGGIAAMFILFSALLLVAGVVVYLVCSFFLMKVFEKAGVQGAWRAWVPVYNTMVFSKLGDLSPWIILIGYGVVIVLGAVPGLNSITVLVPAAVLAVAAWRVGLKLQKPGPWVILAVLLPPVWLGILAFDRSRWNTAVPPAPWAGNGFFADSTVWEGVPVQTAAAAGPTPPPPGAQYPAPPAPEPPAATAAPVAEPPAPPTTEPPADPTLPRS